MKTLNQKELEQVAGGYRWSDFCRDWKDFWEEMGKGFSKVGDDTNDTWKKARDAVHGSQTKVSLIDEDIIVVKALRI